MTGAPLTVRSLLDPRPALDAARTPIADAVNIPFAELPARTHELPPRDEVIAVAGPADLAERVAAWLTGVGRRAVACADFAWAGDAEAAPRGRLWRPSEFLCEVLPLLLPAAAGDALDLACGTGRDAVYLASCGWAVTAADILPDALERGRDLAGRYAPALAPMRWVQVDLERDPTPVAGLYDLVVAFRYLHRPLLQRLPGWLRPGGSVVHETFTTLHRERYGRPAAESHVLRPGELPGLLAGLEIRHYSEAWRGPAHTARIWAVRR